MSATSHHQEVERYSALALMLETPAAAGGLYGLFGWGLVI
jgi:hypothetical protein